MTGLTNGWAGPLKDRPPGIEGQLWLDTNTASLHVFTRGNWVEVVSDDGVQPTGQGPDMPLTSVNFRDLPEELQQALAELRLLLRHWLPPNTTGVQLTMDNLDDPNAEVIVSSVDVRYLP